jgi:preprotein translocase SecE subunit
MKNFLNNIVTAPSRFFKFLRSVGTEMRKTEFPTRARSFRLAATVLIGSILISLTLFGIDALFIFIRTYLTNLNQ